MIYDLIKNLDEYEQREAKNTKSSLTLQQYCLQKKKKTRHSHTTLTITHDNTIRIVMLKMKPWFRTTQTNHRKIKHNDFHTATTKSQAKFFWSGFRVGLLQWKTL